ncbi:MAG: FtsW/RodA/SpoVE family cell cycle protein [Candidatus Absconditabacterales bacterium]
MNIFTIGGLLILYGIVALFSVSIHESFTLTLGWGDPSNYFYFLRQLRNIAVGVVIARFVYKTPLATIRSRRYIILGVVLVVTLLLFSPLGIELNGARLRLQVPVLGTLQPGEFFKLGFVLLVSDWLIRKKALLNSFAGFMSFGIVTGLCYFLFLLLRDNGTILILGLVSLILYWYLGGKKRYVLMLIGGGIIAGFLIVSQVNYVRDRFEAFINPNSDQGGTRSTWQVKNALLAVGGGGLWGKGYGKGLQKFGYIPEAQSDYIFAAYSEEVGLIGNSILIGLYVWLILFFLLQLKYVRDDYLRAVGVGCISLIVIQAFINIGVNINILPSTGLTLPFISFGGTAIMVNLIELVLLHKILVEGKGLKKLY